MSSYLQQGHDVFSKVVLREIIKCSHLSVLDHPQTQCAPKRRRTRLNSIRRLNHGRYSGSLNY